MRIATIEELRAEAPGVKVPIGWKPDPDAILGRLETLIAKGVHIGSIEKGSGVPENEIHALLDEADRSSLRHGPFRCGGVDDGSNVRRLYQLSNWIDAHDAQSRQAALKFTRTETSLYIAGLGAEALEAKRLFHLIGGYGIGKTKALERFAETHPMTHETPGAVYLAMTDEDRTAAQVYRRVADAIRLAEKYQTRGRSHGQRVRNSLRSGDLLIVDEANYAFKHGGWATLRDIHDNAEASLIMASNPEANGFVKSNQEELGALLSRARTVSLRRNEAADGQAYATALGYTCPKMIREAGIIVTRPGQSSGMRGLAKTFEDAEKMAAKKGVPVDLAILRQAAKTNSVFFK